MSIRRIESAYATYFGDERLSGPEMAILIALSYVANEKRNEDCFPSDHYLEQLTHFGNSTIRNARKTLKSLNIIDWQSGGKRRQGGNTSNRYSFLFPHQDMRSKRDRYQPLEATLQGIQPPTPPDTVPTPPDTVPSVTTYRTLRHEITTNTERTPNKTSESKSEPNVVCSSGGFEELFGRKATVAANPLRKYPILVQLALQACGVSDEYNANAFRKVIDRLEPNWVDQEICAFKSEINQGEHEGARNLAAILMVRLSRAVKS